MKTYRTDYATDDQPETPVVQAGLSRRQAMQKARSLSLRSDVGMAYAIATEGGKDTGQRVYAHGSFANQDGAF